MKLLSSFVSLWKGQGSGRIATPHETPRDFNIESFEQMLDDARARALSIGFLYVLSKLLGFLVLSYVTLFLIRSSGVLSLLPFTYFSFALCWVLVDAARLASASFFIDLLMHPLATQSQAPAKIHHSENLHYPRSLRARRISNRVQFCFIALNFAFFILGIPIYRDYLRDLRLYLFFLLVGFNALVACLILVFSCRAFALVSYESPALADKPHESPAYDQSLPQESILRYFDTVLERATSSGLAGAGNFDFFRFAYTMLGDEFRQNVQPEGVARRHVDLIKYLYFHRLGVDFLLIFMDEKDAFVQLAAINMVGFWADRTWGVGLPDSEVMKLPKEVLRKLVDKVGMGQLGWAATTSIGVLASMPERPMLEWTEKLVQTCKSRKQNLLDGLGDSIDASSNRSLSFVRTLVQLFEQLCRNAPKPPVERFEEKGRADLVSKLKRLAETASVQRLRLQAAYLLALMGQPCDRSTIEAIKEPTLRDPSTTVEATPRNDYWFLSEWQMLVVLRERKLPKDVAYGVNMDKGIYPPTWLIDPLDSSENSNV